MSGIYYYFFNYSCFLHLVITPSMNAIYSDTPLKKSRLLVRTGEDEV